MPEISFCLFDLGYLFKLFPKTDNEFNEKLRDFETTAEAQMEKNYAGELSPYYGFLFDYASMEAEYTACLNIVNEYKKSLWVGAGDVEETLNELNGRLESAGVDELIALKQQQLDEWLSQQE